MGTGAHGGTAEEGGPDEADVRGSRQREGGRAEEEREGAARQVRHAEEDARRGEEEVGGEEEDDAGRNRRFQQAKTTNTGSKSLNDCCERKEKIKTFLLNFFFHFFTVSHK